MTCKACGYSSEGPQYVTKRLRDVEAGEYFTLVKDRLGTIRVMTDDPIPTWTNIQSGVIYDKTQLLDEYVYMLDVTISSTRQVVIVDEFKKW